MAPTTRPRLTAGDGRRFGLTLGSAFLALAALALWRGRMELPVALGITGVVLTMAGILIPTRLGPLEHAWMTFAHAISVVTTPIVMAVVYFGVMMPVGLLRRVVAHNPIAHRESGGGFWKKRTSGRSSSMERQF